MTLATRTTAHPLKNARQKRRTIFSANGQLFFAPALIQLADLTPNTGPSILV
jgi:hypothetical protein